MTAAGTSLRRSAMTQKTPEARRPAQRRAEERPAGPARRGPGPGLSPPAAPGSAAKPAFFSPTAAGRQLAPFRRACPFFCHDDTRQMERIHSGLQVQVFHFTFSFIHQTSKMQSSSSSSSSARAVAVAVDP
ncbi:uncharacterized protein LOC115343022 isoform X11 [Aquila chrysaetos chrysaetos]|uniref:uncharacterized protein LOC115343022 isoform X11 n=1 Tax=Aquila chrysaetos chrysaetos TaxID=223781 RepID=UPI0011768705|nr:uncharacterized protein LOC115343022 isoform X11 [Aquila chrysaetos chrysaetos]